MKKVSVYFTDPQSLALEARAAQAGITYAEALRRALDEWLAFKEGRTMPDEAPTAVTSTVYVHLRGHDRPLCFRHATAEPGYDGELDVYRGEKQVAHFQGEDVWSWYVDED